MLGRKNIQPPSCLRCTVLRRKDCPLTGDSEATINSLSSQKYHDTLTNTFVERSTQYTSFSSRKQPANAGIEGKQFTENASVALQQLILTHAHTKCPPVNPATQRKKHKLLLAQSKDYSSYLLLTPQKTTSQEKTIMNT